MKLKRPELEPVRFVAIERAFKPQVKVQATRDLSGWVDRGKKTGRPIKWSIAAGHIGCMDEDTAREFQVKGFVRILDGSVAPVSEQEAAEMLSTVHTISLGDPNG